MDLFTLHNLLLILAIHFTVTDAAGGSSSSRKPKKPNAAPPPVKTREWTHQIRCIGYVPNNMRKYFTSAGSEGQWTTPRTMCAKTWYGGQPDANLGGYCEKGGTSSLHLFFEDHPVQWRFEKKAPDASSAAEVLETDKKHQNFFRDIALAFCQLRCRCLSESTLALRRVHHWPADEIRFSEPPEPYSYDKNEPAPNALMIENQLTAAQKRQTRLNIWFMREATGGGVWDMPVMTIFPIHGTFRPGCMNKLPAMVPIPFRLADFRTAQELCASYFHGGSPAGSAGMVCMENNDKPGRRKLVMLEYLAHPSPSLCSRNGSPGLAIHLWCSSICLCNLDDSREQLRITIKEVKEWNDRGLELDAIFENGRVLVVRESDGGPAPADIPDELGYSDDPRFPSSNAAALTLLPPSNIALPDSASSSLLFYPKRRSPSVSDSTRIGSYPRCGASCSGPNQCGNECMCVTESSVSSLQKQLAAMGVVVPFTRTGDLRSVDMAMVGFTALCVSLQLIQNLVSIGRFPVAEGLAEWLVDRDIGGGELPFGKMRRDVREELVPKGILCPCNETEAAERCCEWNLLRGAGKMDDISL